MPKHRRLTTTQQLALWASRSWQYMVAEVIISLIVRRSPVCGLLARTGHGHERMDTMAYTALETMRQSLKARFGEDLGPMQPPASEGEKTSDLKSAALRFLRERCEGLRHDGEIARREAETGVLVKAWQE